MNWNIHALLILCLLLSAKTARAGDTLVNVCGPENQVASLGNTQKGLLCQAAYAGGNSWVQEDNLTRVKAAVAVTCAYNCLSGGLISSCSGGDACSTAVQNGTDAYIADQDGTKAYYSAAHNTNGAIQYKATNAFQSSAGTNSGVTPLPASCQNAVQTGSVTDRISCAAASDPNLPSFVQSPQFLSDFQKATGVSLQAVINQSGSTILHDYAPDALQYAYNSLGKDVSLTDFLGRGAKLVASMAGTLTKNSDRLQLIDYIVPSGLKKMIPGLDAWAADSVAPPATRIASVASPATDGLHSDSEKVSKEPAAAARALASTSGVLDESNASIFARVSAQYKRQYDAENMDHLSWASPFNRYISAR